MAGDLDNNQEASLAEHSNVVALPVTPKVRRYVPPELDREPAPPMMQYPTPMSLDVARFAVEEYGALRDDSDVRSWMADILHDAACRLLQEIDGNE